MTKLTRRSFLQQSPASAAALSLLPAMPAFATSYRSPKVAAPRLSAKPPGSMVIHVHDVAADEMTLFAGTREVVLRDPRLVALFVEAAG